MAFQDSVTKGLPLTRDNFTDPPMEMGIVPFWFWNGDLDYDEMDWQLRQYHDRGVRNLFIHGRMGLNVGYLSDEWFKRVRFVVDRAKEIGIDAWVYDEMDWPSGTAQKQVMKADPDLQQRRLELVALPFEGPIFNFLEAHDDRYVATGNSNPIAAYAARRDEYETVIENLVDLNKNLAWEKTIAWEAPAGAWVLMYFVEKTDPYYIDTLNPASTRKFIELTHERYRKTVGDEFGKTVPGFFTDEPAMYYYHVGLKNYVVPWSKQMFKIFRQRRGYDLKPYLPALYRDIGEDTVRVRYDFWRTLTEQYAETYYKQLRDWCEANGVLFTGHVLFEEHLRLAARCEGNIFKYLEQMHMTGVDHLYPKIGSPKEPDQHVALKLASSAAHHYGSPRLLCESMGGTYWDCTLERMKWQNNWEYALGVNLFNNHGYHYTIEGERKRDWPPSQFYHHTWWKYYDRFTRYNARLSHALTGGRHVARVLMLYPIASTWTNYMPQEITRVAAVIEQDFNYLTDTLLRLHFDFDYVDEDVLAEATVADGRLRIRDEEYEVFILPPVTHIKQKTYEKLRAFVASGGSLIADTLVPVGLLEAGDDGARVARLDDFFGYDGRALLEAFEQNEEGAFEVVPPNGQGNVFFFKGDGLYSRKIQIERLVRETGPESKQVKEFLAQQTGAGAEVSVDHYLAAQGALDERKKEALRQVLLQSLTPDVVVGDEEVFYLHRRKDGLDLYFLTNTSQTDRGRVTISFEQVARPELWDPNTGAVRPIPVYRVEDGRLVIELDFPPSESYIVVLSGEIDAPHVAGSNLDVVSFDGGVVTGYARGPMDDAVARVVLADGREKEVRLPTRPALDPIELPQTYDFDIEQDNVLLVDRWKMLVEDDGHMAGQYHLPEFDAGHWLDVTNGAWEMQLPHERDEATYPVTLWYRTHFDLNAVPPDTRLMIDGFSGSEYTLYVNGEEIEDKGKRSWLDAEIREVDLQPYVKPGHNTVVVRLVARRRTDGMLDLLKIVGRFALAGSKETGYAAVPLRTQIEVGDWTQQGYPFFSGTGVYRATFDVPEAYLDGGRLLFEADCGEDVLEVSINGSEGRVAPWHPYRIDVTDLVRAGANDVEIRVTNTLINILEGVRHPSGLFRRPRIVHEHRYELAIGQ